MKITKSQLKQIIREELENVVEGPDLDNDGQSNAKEAYRIAYVNYAQEVFLEKATELGNKARIFKPLGQRSGDVDKVINLVIDQLADEVIRYARYDLPREELVAEYNAELENIDKNGDADEADEPIA